MPDLFLKGAKCNDYLIPKDFGSMTDLTAFEFQINAPLFLVTGSETTIVNNEDMGIGNKNKVELTRLRLPSKYKFSVYSKFSNSIIPEAIEPKGERCSGNRKSVKCFRGKSEV